MSAISGKMLSAGLLRGGSGTRSSTKDDSQAKIASSTFDSMKICRVTSPDSYEAGCTPNCSMTLPEQRVKANVVRISRTLHRNPYWKSRRFHCPHAGIMSWHMTTMSQVKLSRKWVTVFHASFSDLTESWYSSSLRALVRFVVYSETWNTYSYS
jgi:hypothetical protein